MKQYKNAKLRRALTRDAALQCIPVKNSEVEEKRQASGEAQLSYPIQMKPWMAKLARFFGNSSERQFKKKLQLDMLGTAVWDMIDGKHSVRQMIQKFAEAHQLHKREAEVAITQFIRELGKRGLVGIK